MKPKTQVLENKIMPMTAGEIETLIKAALPDAQVRIDDLRGDGDHYSALIVSSAFEGLTRVKQHKLVYDALEGRMGVELHALSIQTKTPD